jgi:heme exporter protein D
MNAFFAMGGYAAFIWPAYAATLVGLGGAIVLTWRAYRAAERRLAALGADEP